MSCRAAVLACAVLLGACSRDDAVQAAFRTADSLLLNGRFADARPRFGALRDSFVATGDTRLQLRAQLGWSETLLRTGRLDSAALMLDEARRLAAGDTALVGRTQWLRSLLQHRQGKLDSAAGSAINAIATARAAGDRLLETDALSAHATVLSLSGRYRVAAAYAESALALERTLNRPPQHITVRFNNLGIEYRHIGRLSDADRLFREGLEIARTLPSQRSAMLLSANLANVRLMAGDLDGALRLRESAMRSAEVLQDAQGLVVSNGDMADLYLVGRNFTAARRHYEQSLAANTPVRFMYGKISALWGLGRLETEEGNIAAAQQRLGEAMALADSGNWRRERSEIRASRAHASVAGRDVAGALRWSEAALRLADSVEDIEARLRALNARAAALEAAGRRDAPAPSLEAIDLLESARGRIALGDLRMGVAEEYWHVYEGAIRTLLARGDAAEAFAVAERAKARMLLELMAERDASRQAASAQERLRERVRVLVEERDGARGDSLRAALDAEIARSVDSLQALERDERARDAAGAARYPNPVTASEVAPLVAGSRVLLSYFWGERHIYGWSLSGGAVRAARLGGVDSISAQIDFFLASVAAASSDWRAPARRLYSTLLAPLLPAGAGDALIVPDGPLAHVPFAALLPPQDSVPWGVTRRLSYGPSASVLKALATRSTEAWPRAALVVGDPSGRRSTAVAIATRGEDQLGPLPFAAREARAIFDLFRAGGSDLLLSSNATLARWQVLDPARYRYLHFAAHALVSDRIPEETRLVLADRGLDLAEIRRQRLRAELVTLSACETALGLRVRGEGVIGLPHAFLAAGARGVVVTLWKVDDEAAAVLMQDFYREVAAGQPAAEALRRARASHQAEHPSRWAAFIYVGAL